MKSVIVSVLMFSTLFATYANANPLITDLTSAGGFLYAAADSKLYMVQDGGAFVVVGQTTDGTRISHLTSAGGYLYASAGDTLYMVKDGGAFVPVGRTK